MDTITEMLKAHPKRPHGHFERIAQCLAACTECEQICIACADACLEEDEVAALRQCIRIDQDCADLCAATARMIQRQAHPDAALWQATLLACAQACRSCSAECMKHESAHAHCRLCREACDRCERTCMELLRALPEGGAEITH